MSLDNKSLWPQCGHGMAQIPAVFSRSTRGGRDAQVAYPGRLPVYRVIMSLEDSSLFSGATNESVVSAARENVLHRGSGLGVQ